MRVVKILLLIICCAYILWYATFGFLVGRIGHPIGAIYDPDPRHRYQGDRYRTHYWVFRPGYMWELGLDWFDLHIPITMEDGECKHKLIFPDIEYEEGGIELFNVDELEEPCAP